MDIWILLLFVLGLVLLIFGADILVRGASRLAARIGVSPLFVGLTVVAFGTSAPELAVSLKASISMQDTIALGNAVGSNIFNVCFILGLSALIKPLIASNQLVRFDVPIMILVSVLLFIFGFNNTITRIEGGILFGGIILYLFIVFILTRVNAPAERNPAQHKWFKNVFFIILGLVSLIYGADYVVRGAVEIAKLAGLSELVIGLTIVAMGTSLPEAATSVMAVIRGERDIAIGNVVGSNIFNILAVTGLSGIFAPDGLNVLIASIHFDIPVMIFISILCMPVFFTGHSISRFEGFVFLMLYCVYTILLIYSAKHNVMVSLLNLNTATVIVMIMALYFVTSIVMDRKKNR